MDFKVLYFYGDVENQGMHLLHYGVTPEIRRDNRLAEERRQMAAASSTTGQPRGNLSVRGIQEVQSQRTTAEAAIPAGAPTAPLSQQEQIRQARLEAFSKRQQPAQEPEMPGINHTVEQVSPPKNEEPGFLSTLSSAAASLAQAVGLTAQPLTAVEKEEQQANVRNARIGKLSQPSAPSAPSVQGGNSSSSRAPALKRAFSVPAIETIDYDTLAAKRFDQLDERQA